MNYDLFIWQNELPVIQNAAFIFSYKIRRKVWNIIQRWQNMLKNNYWASFI